ncbi:retron St85 family RNA-directed DNA polymerase [Shimia thalassica]|uniref:retron St85 family RNA-directed DNA polymerase n=1 Tax=Shimia thalassica TaxID=1715693 RepID=UPI002493D496|nr:retron St85 family RNA-directed DNA polymerase [Shimia thalassica]
MDYKDAPDFRTYPEIRSILVIHTLKAVFWTGFSEMPTRSFHFPDDFRHIEAILSSEDPQLDVSQFQKFRDRGIAPLLTSLDIAIVLGVGPQLIVSIMKKKERHYRSFPLLKKDGTERIISAPRVYLKVIQWWILENILSKLPSHKNAFGFSRNKSIQDNARFHAGSKHILNVDIRSFFDTVTECQVQEIFVKLGYSEDTSETLSSLCTLNGSLPQGAPTSPSLANLVLAETDDKLENLATTRGMKYSRYADDITFSSDEFIAADFHLEVEKFLKVSGFQLKSAKTRYAGSGNRREVTGLICGKFVQPPLQWRKNSRARVHKLGKKPFLEREDVAYLLGLRGYAMQFPDAVQMKALLTSADALLAGQQHDKEPV